MSTSIKTTTNYKSYSILEKYTILKEIEKDTVVNVSIKRNIPKRTLYRLVKDKKEIFKAFNSKSLKIVIFWQHFIIGTPVSWHKFWLSRRVPINGS